MPKKLTLQDIKQFINKNDINNECTLLSTEYINSSTPMKFQCNICGNIFERDYAHLKRGRFKCATCGRSSGGGNNKLSFNDVKKYITENDINNECTLLSTEYINSSTPMKFQCNICGNIFERDYAHLKRGRFKCATCGVEAGAKKLKYTKEDVAKDIFEQRQYIMIGEYIKADKPVKVKCIKGHKFNLIYSQFKQGKSGCRECANLNMKGVNHPNWNGGGHQSTVDAFRHALLPWKQLCLKEANYKCDITGVKKDLVVHHLDNFSTILQNTLIKLNIPYYNNISEFSEEERNLITIELLKQHTKELGVVLNKNVHDRFHQVYSKKNNTKEQYEEFKRKYYDVN